MSPARASPPAFFLVLSVAVETARAQHLNAELEVTRTADASSCIDVARLARIVEKRLRRDAFDEKRNSELTLQVSFERSGVHWTSRVRLSDRLGHLGLREISTSAPHCSAIDDSLALVVALLVDTPPVRADALPAQESPDVERPPSALPASRSAARPPTIIELPADTLAPREPFRFDLRLCSAFGVGLIGGLSPGIEIGVGAKPPRGPWLRLVGDVFVPQEQGLAGGMAGVRLSSGRVGVEVCGFSSPWGRVETELCAGQKIGAVLAEGFGFDSNQDSSRLYYALTLGGDAFVALGKTLGIVFGLHAEIPLTRDHFTARVDESGEASSLFQAPPVAAVARVGLRADL